ncbi:hypothetical protein ACMD2_15568 [Ananas comosus]|uniref:Uncharacterized protein n=1 Tax=Ananas comosus TaxID=4615 RepID=A0A199UYF4_ANACO|nr:hypothetical protein ACMD2_15568 [Ananas comosus]
MRFLLYSIYSISTAGVTLTFTPRGATTCAAYVEFGVPTLWSTTSAVVIIADRTAAGLHDGWADRTRAVIPLTWGQAMDVPDSTVKFDLLRSSGRLVGPRLSGQAAMMFTPGAMTSGLSTDGFVMLGPREENRATAGALARPTVVPP